MTPLGEGFSGIEMLKSTDGKSGLQKPNIESNMTRQIITSFLLFYGHIKVSSLPFFVCRSFYSFFIALYIFYSFFIAFLVRTKTTNKKHSLQVFSWFVLFVSGVFFSSLLVSSLPFLFVGHHSKRRGPF